MTESNGLLRRLAGHDPSPKLDRAFETLGHPSRRRVLLLVGADNPRTADEFSVELAGDDSLDRQKTDLRHVHLPKLDDCRYVDWDPDSNTVRRGPNYDEVAPLLRLLFDHYRELPDGW